MPEHHLRSDLIRIAAELPPGNETRRELLAALSTDEVMDLRMAAASLRWDKKDGKLTAEDTSADPAGENKPDKVQWVIEHFRSDWSLELHYGSGSDYHRMGNHKSLKAAKGAAQKQSDEWAALRKKQKKTARPDVLQMILPMKDVANLKRTMGQVNDEQSEEMIYEIWRKLQDALDLTSGEAEALGRLRNCVENANKWDPSLLRNNIFKAANSLGIRLPSAMFASNKTARELSDDVNWDIWHVYDNEDVPAHTEGGLEDAYEALQDSVGRSVGDEDDPIDKIRGEGKFLGTVDNGNLAVYKDPRYTQLILVRDVNGPWGVDVDARRPKPNDYSDAVTFQDSRGGYSVAVDGKFVGEYREWDDAMAEVKREVQQHGGYYEINDHGNVTQYDARGREIDSWV